jgi:prepilin-type N-terminal cleavage/methylation domain-containing protein
MSSSTIRCRASRRGFSLTELLVVIGVIAILTAILFPVFSTVRESARKAQCRENLQTIHKALKDYQADHGQYPEALFGLSRNNGPLEMTLGNTDYVADRNTFTCPSAMPSVRNNMTLVVPTNRSTGQPAMDRAGRTLSYPMMDSYDIGYVPNNTTGTAELHYNRAWTGANQGLSTDKRQLIRKDAPGETVVTWCLNHASFDGSGVPKAGSKALVLLLNGRVVEVDAQKMVGWPGPDGNQPWQVQP